MELSSGIVHLKITLKEVVAVLLLMFADVGKPLGLIINHNDPIECYILFQSDEYITDVLKLAGTT